LCIKISSKGEGSYSTQKLTNKNRVAMARL
jgi:hypothetical protein